MVKSTIKVCFLHVKGTILITLSTKILLVILKTDNMEYNTSPIINNTNIIANF